ncbi:nucleoside diphosphate kinase regulator [Noviherbaspirillum sp. Root189]|uniref:nucleoside diphosphate kinase regulator n=1 Tax=Noviherbaspirillum sp. Root189 TaxID=1736487 RepID=UPI000710E6DC|nr:nucleoside diphosphate kinase regulator [Noviherbaspirillum sp. Root189]KRB84025.1 nucleoside diphosphate kinase regulator [Noviherbaspirillum sp. Root189]
MKPDIIVSAVDAERLETIADLLPASAIESKNALLDELGRANIVEPDQMPATVVTMNSTVQFEITSPKEEFCMTLVYPSDIGNGTNQISVLTPIGTALLGLAEGSQIEWPRPDGQSVHVRILKVIAQPRQAGVLQP